MVSSYALTIQLDVRLCYVESGIIYNQWDSFLWHLRSFWICLKSFFLVYQPCYVAECWMSWISYRSFHCLYKWLITLNIPITTPLVNIWLHCASSKQEIQDNKKYLNSNHIIRTITSYFPVSYTKNFWQFKILVRNGMPYPLLMPLLKVISSCSFASFFGRCTVSIFPQI